MTRSPSTPFNLQYLYLVETFAASLATPNPLNPRNAITGTNKSAHDLEDEETH
jgi:hypothetical protein